MIQWEQQQENMYFEAAKQAHADFFRGISSGREWHEARENIEEWYIPDGEPVQLVGSSSSQRVNLIKDFTCYAKHYREYESPIFQYGPNTRFKLHFSPQINQPGNAVYVQMDNASRWTQWSYSDILNLDLFQMISNDCLVKVMRSSRKTGQPITADQILDEDPSFRDNCRRNNFKKYQLDAIANQLNHLTLLWDLEIARHLQKVFNYYSSKFAELPVGFGVALVFQLYGDFNDHDSFQNFEQKMFGLFSGSPFDRANVLKTLIKDYVEKHNLIGRNFSFYHSHFYSLLDDEFCA